MLLQGLPWSLALAGKPNETATAVNVKTDSFITNDISYLINFQVSDLVDFCGFYDPTTFKLMIKEKGDSTILKIETNKRPITPPKAGKRFATSHDFGSDLKKIKQNPPNSSLNEKKTENNNEDALPEGLINLKSISTQSPPPIPTRQNTNPFQQITDFTGGSSNV